MAGHSRRASNTSGFTTAAGRRPASISAIAAVACRAPRASVSLVAPPMCGVMNTPGRSSSGCRAPLGRPLDDVERGAGQVAAAQRLGQLRLVDQ